MATASARLGPGTHTAASHGVSSPGPAPTRGAVKAPLTARITVTSWAYRRRKSAWRTRGSWTTLTATDRPNGNRPGKTRPIPPAACRGRSTSGHPFPHPRPCRRRGRHRPRRHTHHSRRTRARHPSHPPRPGVLRRPGATRAGPGRGLCAGRGDEGAPDRPLLGARPRPRSVPLAAAALSGRRCPGQRPGSPAPPTSIPRRLTTSAGNAASRISGLLPRPLCHRVMGQ